MVKKYKGELSFLLIAIMAYIFMATLDISQNYSYFSVVFGIFGLVVAWKIYEKVDEQSDGTEKMREIAEAIHEGAMVFLSREYKILGYFVGTVFILLMVVISCNCNGCLYFYGYLGHIAELFIFRCGVRCIWFDRGLENL